MSLDRPSHSRITNGWALGLAFTLAVPQASWAGSAQDPVEHRDGASLAIELQTARAQLDAGNYDRAVTLYSKLAAVVETLDLRDRRRVQYVFGLSAAQVGLHGRTGNRRHLQSATRLLSGYRARLAQSPFSSDTDQRLLVDVDGRLAEVERRLANTYTSTGSTGVRAIAAPPPAAVTQVQPAPAPVVEETPPPPRRSSRAKLTPEGRDLVARSRGFTGGGIGTIVLVPAGLLSFAVSGLVRVAARSNLEDRDYRDFTEYSYLVRDYNVGGKVAFASLMVSAAALPIAIALLATGSALRRRGKRMTAYANRQGFGVGLSTRF